MTHEPLHIRAVLMTSVISDLSLPIDAILFFFWHAIELGPKMLDRPGEHLSDRGLGAMPFLAIANRGKPTWFYRASWAIWPERVADGTDAWVKRNDFFALDYLDHRARINIGSGRYKNYRMPVWYRSATHVDWYLVGDADEIRRVLSVATHIGKKTAHGWGRVREWIVEPSERDYSIVRDGKLVRGVPLDALPKRVEFARTHYGFRPSYWLAQNQAEIAVPAGWRN